MPMAKKLRKPGEAENLKDFCKKIGIPYEGEENGILKELENDYDFEFLESGRLYYKPLNTEEKRRRKRVAKQLEKEKKKDADYQEKIDKGVIIKRQSGDICLTSKSKYEDSKLECLVLYNLLILLENPYYDYLYRNLLLKAVFDNMGIVDSENRPIKEAVDSRTNAFVKLYAYTLNYLYDVLDASLKKLVASGVITLGKRYVDKNDDVIENESVDSIGDEIYREHFIGEVHGNKWVLYNDPDIRERFYAMQNERLRELGYEAVDHCEMVVGLQRLPQCYERLKEWMEQGNTLQVIRTNLFEIIRHHVLRHINRIEIENFERKGFRSTEFVKNIKQEMEEYINQNMINVENNQEIKSLDDIEFDTEIFEFNMLETFNSIEEKIKEEALEEAFFVY